MRAVNLLPRETPRRRKRSAGVVQLALVSPFLVVSLLAAGYLLESSKVNDSKATLQALRDELATLPPPSAGAQAGQPQLVLQRNERIAALGSALQARVAWDRILREISTVLPEDVWLTTLSAQAPAAQVSPPPSTTTTETQDANTTTTTAAPAPPPTAPLSLAGYTYSHEGVARFLSRLAVIPELQDVKLVESSQKTVAGRVVVSFSIQAGVRTQAAA